MIQLISVALADPQKSGMEMKSAVIKFLPQLAAALIVLTALLVYTKTLNNGLVWDSTFYLKNNESHIASLNLENIWWMLTTFELSNWHPLTWFSWAVDYQLYGGLNPAGYHFTNNLIHALNSGLVFVLMLYVFGLTSDHSRHIRVDHHALISALLAALLFAVHPQHVESVAWVAERKDLLCQFFMLLTMWAYFQYVSQPVNYRVRWYLCSLAMFALAVMSKPMAVTLPVLLFLLDVYPLRRSSLLPSGFPGIVTQSVKRLILEKIPFFGFAALLAFLTMQAQHGAMTDVPIGVRILNAFNSLSIYINKFLIPVEFSPHYPFFTNPGDVLTWHAYIPVLGFIGVSVVSVFLWFKDRHAWLVSWAFYVIGMIPVLGLVAVGTQGFADRYAYFPTLPFYFLIGAGILKLLDMVASTSIRYAILPASLAIVVLLASKTDSQVQIWRNELTLWQQSVISHPDNPIARNHFGVSLLVAGDYENAISQFNAIESMPVNPTMMLSWRSLSYLHLARYKEALSDHEKMAGAASQASGLVLDEDCYQYNLGWLNAQLQSPAESVAHFQQVNLASAHGPNARVWIDYLERSQHDPDTAVSKNALPGFCSILIPELWG